MSGPYTAIPACPRCLVKAGRGARAAAVVAAAAAAGMLAATASEAHARVLVDLVQVGFPTRQNREGVVRVDCWAAIVVDVTIEEQPAFDGRLRVAQRDGDGDVIYDSVEVHLLASSGGTQRYWLYTLPNPGSGEGANIGVELLNEEGEAVTFISAGQPTLMAVPDPRPLALADDAAGNNVLMLAVSVASGGRLMDLGARGFDSPFVDRIHVGHIAPQTLPSLWIGLESVDYVIWDEADPADLSARQLEALIEWTRQGGTLLIAASRTAAAVAQSAELAGLIPVTIGPAAAVGEWTDFARKLFGVHDAGNVGEGPIPVAQCAAKPGTLTYYRHAPAATDLLVRGRHGRGHVYFCGATLSDLFKTVDPRRVPLESEEEAAPSGAAAEFYKRLFFLKTITSDHVQHNAEYMSLFEQVESPVTFPGDAGLYLLITIAFTVVYVLAATFGTWTFLKRRGWERHSWSAFSVVAGLAAVLSVMTVEAMQGFGETVHQITVVDALAGQTYGYASALIGLKSSAHVNLDAWLPGDYRTAIEPTATSCFLRPVGQRTDGYEGASTTYADPGRYTLVPGSAVLDDVPTRATLKRLEGRWEGRLDGRVSAFVKLTRGSSNVAGDIRFSPDSFILNELGVDLRQCYVLCTTGPAYSPATGMPALPQRSGDFVFAIPIRDLPAGQKVMLASRFDPEGLQGLGKAESNEELRKYALANEHKRWRSSQSLWGGLTGSGAPGGAVDMGLAPEQAALMIASTAGDWDAGQHKNTFNPQYEQVGVCRGRLRHLDLRGQLYGDAVVLVGFAADAGPVRVATRTGARAFRNVTPAQAMTMYRIVIPMGQVLEEGSGNSE